MMNDNKKSSYAQKLCSLIKLKEFVRTQKLTIILFSVSVHPPHISVLHPRIVDTCVSSVLRQVKEEAFVLDLQ